MNEKTEPRFFFLFDKKDRARVFSSFLIKCRYFFTFEKNLPSFLLLY